jgi:hypothetical protein
MAAADKRVSGERLGFSSRILTPMAVGWMATGHRRQTQRQQQQEEEKERATRRALTTRQHLYHPSFTSTAHMTAAAAAGAFRYENDLFVHFPYTNDHFTKPGSGQT